MASTSGVTSAATSSEISSLGSWAWNQMLDLTPPTQDAFPPSASTGHDELQVGYAANKNSSNIYLDIFGENFDGIEIYDVAL